MTGGILIVRSVLTLENKDTIQSVCMVPHVKVRKGGGSEGQKIMSDGLHLLTFSRKLFGVL